MVTVTVVTGVYIILYIYTYQLKIEEQTLEPQYEDRIGQWDVTKKSKNMTGVCSKNG